MADLLPHHRAELAKSGLDAAAISAAGFYSEDRPAELNRLLNWKGGAAKLGPCLVLPFPAADGTPTDFCQLKPDRPRTGQKNTKDGVRAKAVKYESPKGRPSRVYLPPLARAALADPTVPFILTEGVKKCVCGDAHGLACLGLVGVDAWSASRPKGPDGRPIGPRVLSEELAAIPWAGRPVVLVNDSDAASNPNVRRAERHLARVLAAAGAVVRVARLPPAADGSKQGLDDFVVANGPDALRAVVDGAKPAERPTRSAPPPPPDRPPPVNERPDDPHRLARSYLALVDDGGPPRLHYWRGEWQRWADGCYRPVPDGELVAAVNRHVKREFDDHYRAESAGWQAAGADPKQEPKALRVTGRLVADVVRAMEGYRVLPMSLPQPRWLGEAVGRPDPATVVAFPNGLLDLPAFAAGRPDAFRPPTPAFFGPTVLAFPFDPNAQEPAAWLGFLAGVWQDDAASVACLREWFAYLLTGRTDLQKLLLLVGPPRSGRSTILRVLTALVGPDNVATPTLADLGDRFGLSLLPGKSLATVTDAHLARRADGAAVVERLKSIVGEDAQQVDRKNKELLTCRLGVRFVIATNELPKLPDPSGAFARRLVVLKFLVSFAGREDDGLTARLLAELPGIFNWAAGGYPVLLARRRFAQPAGGADLIRQVDDLSSPVGAFVRERCLIGPDERILVKELWAEWRAWCAQANQQPGDEQMFGKNLLAKLSHLKQSRPWVAGTRQRQYVGVRLRTPDDPDPDEFGPRGPRTHVTDRQRDDWNKCSAERGAGKGLMGGELPRAADHADQTVDVDGVEHPAGDAWEPS